MPPCDSQNRLFDTNILEIHLIQAALWQILCSGSPTLVTMATKVGSMVKICIPAFICATL